MGAVYGIVVREFVRFLRQRGRVLASIGRPFVWLVFAGGGFAAVFAGRNEIDYRVYMAPGLLGMVVMFGSLLAALSTVTDREAGVLRMVLVAPIRRSTVAFGKALGATLLGTAQAIVVAAILLPCVQLRPTLAGMLLGLVALVLSGLALGALGVVLAASIRSIENFAGVMNFVVFPMLFLSGALYPVRHLGPVLRTVAYVNPLAYGVDLLKHALLSQWAGAGYGGELPAPLDCAALILCTRVGRDLQRLHAVSLRPDGPSDYVDRHRQCVHAHEIEHVLEHPRLHRGPGAHGDGPERQQAAALAEHDAADGCRDRADGGHRHEVAHVDRAGARELSGDRRPLLRWLEQQAFCPREPARELARGSRFRGRCFDRGPRRGAGLGGRGDNGGGGWDRGGGALQGGGAEWVVCA